MLRWAILVERKADAVNVRGAVWKMRFPEMVQLSLPTWMLMPVTDAVGLKKSKMLLLLMMLSVFALADPILRIPFVGRLVPAGPMLLPITILLLFPAVGSLCLIGQFRCCLTTRGSCCSRACYSALH